MPSKEKIAKERPEQREFRLEYNRTYNKINSETINKRNSEYRKNSQHYIDYRNIKIPCDCGCLLNICNMSRHNKTIKHLEWLKNPNN